MQHRREAPVGGDELGRVDRHLTLLQIPVRPHRLVCRDTAVGLTNIEARRQAEQIPDRPDPRADRDDHLIDRDHTGARQDARATAPEPSSSKPVTSTPRRSWPPPNERLRGEPEHRLAIEGITADVLVQADSQSGGAPIGVQAAHVRRHPLVAEVELRGIADPLLALEHLSQVPFLRRGPERDVAGAVVVERLRIGLPHLDAGGHQLRHRGLEVVVANHAAGDARRPGGNRRS